MTKRAYCIILLFVVLLTTLGYLNDHVLRLESTSNGHQLPIIVIGSLFLFVLLVNPLLGLWGRGRMFKPAELAVIVAISSCACGIGGRALMEQYTQIVALPHYWTPMNAGWQQRDVLSRFPKESLVEPEPFDHVVLRFIIGSDSSRLEGESAPEKVERWFSQVPWKQWKGPLLTWMPFILLVNIAMTALALVVHRQWSRHELLQYPIAEFSATLMQRQEGRLLPDLFRSRFFWIAFACIFLLRLNNGLYQWFPEYIIPVKMQHTFYPFCARWPILYRNSHWWTLMRLNFFPLATGIAFFLSSEISLSLGLSQIVWAVVSISVVSYGVSVSTDYDIGGYQAWTREGAYLAYGLLLFYSGRHYYWSLLRQTFWPLGRKLADAVIPHSSVVASRVLFCSTVALCLLSIRLGLAWPVAILNILLMLLTYLIVSRISAETGLMFIQPGWQPFGMILALFGSYALGPTAIVISGLICGILCIDQSQALMPYLTNGLKLAERCQVSLPKLARHNLCIYIFGTVLCILTGILVSYDVGTTTYYPEWNFKRLPTMAIRASEPAELQLRAQGRLEESERLSGWERIVHIRPQPRFLGAVAIGFLGVLLCHFLRLRTAWWGLHPCLFLTWCTAPLNDMAWPFLFGWFLKKLCQRFGGNQLVQKVRPMAIGAIAADIMGALLFMVVGAVYYFSTGEYPKTYRFFPR